MRKAPLAALRSSGRTDFLPRIGSSSGVRVLRSTPRPFGGRSRMWPMVALTRKDGPSMAESVLALLVLSFRVRATMGHILDLPPNGLGVDRNTLTPELE